MFRLSVCEGTMLRNLSFLERVRTIGRAGFGVDLWGWEDSALDAIADDPAIEICAMPGWSGGSMMHPDGIDEFLAGVTGESDRCPKASVPQSEHHHRPA